MITWLEWDNTDNDCCQYIRKGSDNDSFELIQLVWLDAVTEEEKKSEWIVVRDVIKLSDYNDKEKECYLNSYGYTLRDDPKDLDECLVDDWLIAECILEEECLRDSCIIGKFSNRESAEELIKKIVSEE